MPHLRPDSAVITHLLASHGAPLSEAMVLGIGAGLGAGYILWEFTRHDARHLVLRLRHRWNYLDWNDATPQRLGARFRVHTTAGAKGAAERLTAELDRGGRPIVFPDRYLARYRHLPPYLEAHGGHPVIVYAQTGDHVRVTTATPARSPTPSAPVSATA